MSSRAVRVQPGQPRSGRAKSQQTDGCANPGPLTLPGPTNLNWVIESPMSTEVRLLDHTGSSSQDFQATESSRKVIVTSSKLGEGTRPPSHQAWLLASSHLPNPLLPSGQQIGKGDERGPPHSCVQCGLYGEDPGRLRGMGTGPPAWYHCCPHASSLIPLCHLPRSRYCPVLQR